MDNANSHEYLQKIRLQVIENLRSTVHAPSVQMTDVPRVPLGGMDEEAEAELDDLDEDENPDARNTKRRWDKYVEPEGELSESEDEEENEAHGVRKQPNGQKKRRNMMDFQNPNAAQDDENMQVDNDELSAPSGSRSLNGANGSGHPEGSDIDEPNEAAEDSHDEDVEMVDDRTANTGEPAGTDGAQEATPPESPAQPAAEASDAMPIPPVEAVIEATGDAMDEGDTLDDPEIAKEVGHDERENEDVTAEKATEIVERKEE